MVVDRLNLSEEARQEVQDTIKDAELRLEEIRDEIKTMGFRYQDLLSQEKVVEKQLWLAKLVLDDDDSSPITESPQSTETLGRYTNKTIASAAEQIIKEKSRMLFAREIVDILIEDGRIFANTGNAVASIVTSIKRRPETFFWTNIGGVNHFGLVDILP